jgi:hypothetical protein
MSDTFITQHMLHSVFTKILQNVVVDSLTFLLRIREVPSSNLSPKTGYPDWGVCGFLQSLEMNAGIVP